ncbi:MAG: Lrp/AsnC family transcriptional regulator [Deltaproteobacteria bacterium]|nr:Lrp/AsnC family transcriptional regulator [Deltaproteobacteria bacterium]
MSGPELDHIDRLLVNALQDRFPLVSRPFGHLAAEIGRREGLVLTEAEVLARVLVLKEKKYIRRLGAVLDQNRLGYRSALCAARVPEDKIEIFSKLVSAQEEVTHNYLRNGDFNIWFTFSYLNKEQLVNFLEKLKKESSVQEILELPAEKVYKIRAVFEMPD